MIGPFSIDTYLPSFESIEGEFSASRAMLTQTIAIYMVATAISTLFWGPLSDRIGRKKVILISLSLYSITSLACALASNYSEFLLFRVFQGIVASGGLVAGRAMVRDVYDSRNAQRVMGYVLMLFALAPTIAPIIGGWLHELFGWRSVFYFLSVYGLVNMLICSVVLNESLEVSKRQSFHPLYVFRTYIKTLLHFRFLALVLALATSFGGLFIYIAGAPTVMFDFLNLQSTDFWMQFLPMTCGIILGSFVSGKLIKFWPAQKIINFAFFIMAMGMLFNVAQANWLPAGVIWVLSPIVIYAFGVAISMPGLGIMALDCFPDNKGSAAAMQAFVQVIFAGLVAGLLLPVLSQSILAYASLQLFLLLSAVFFWFLAVNVKKA